MENNRRTSNHISQLEDRVFGIFPELEDEHHEETAVTPCNPTVLDHISDHMLPIVATLILVTVVLWSLNQCIEYNEVFINNSKCRHALFGGNAIAVIVAIAVVIWYCERLARPK